MRNGLNHANDVRDRLRYAFNFLLRQIQPAVQVAAKVREVHPANSSNRSPWDVVLLDYLGGLFVVHHVSCVAFRIFCVHRISIEF